MTVARYLIKRRTFSGSKICLYIHHEHMNKMQGEGMNVNIIQ